MDECPLCGANLIAGPYRREIGYSAHDYIQFWICPDCDGTWNRWPKDSHRWERGEKMRQEYVNR